jgi:hypothetical protein
MRMMMMMICARRSSCLGGDYLVDMQFGFRVRRYPIRRPGGAWWVGDRRGRSRRGLREGKRWMGTTNYLVLCTQSMISYCTVLYCTMARRGMYYYYLKVLELVRTMGGLSNVSPQYGESIQSPTCIPPTPLFMSDDSIRPVSPVTTNY